MFSISTAPKESKSWCKYQLDVANGTSFYTQNNCLPPIFRKELKLLFTRLLSDELLKSCLKGVTQKQNEALNSILWKKCPKSVFCGKQKLTACAADCHTMEPRYSWFINCTSCMWCEQIWN